MGEYIFNASPNHLSNSLLRPTIPQFTPNQFSASHANDPPLLKLSNELLLQNFEAQLTYSDVLNRSAPGADTPLIAVGDYCEPDDIPPAMKGLKDPWNLAARGPIKDGDKALPWFVESGHYFKMVPETPFVPPCAADIMYRFLLKKIADLFSFQTLTQYISNSFHVDILRNLTTKEFVAFADINDNPRDTLLENKGMSFGHGLLRKICWSSDNSMAIYNAPEDMHRGVWAGYCFDVVIGEEAAKEGFKDVGKEVRADFERLWQGKYDGKDWEAHYRDFSHGSSPDLVLGGYI
ncbi:hypothetical protein BDD12DRAFT_892239 [Trichophaea hybrida]|nr:hypothetical protein BDD12DRAFT_892239 [Trichophaea hybrida]